MTAMGAMGAGDVSHTAVLVCQGRAVAHGRLAPGRFDDPTAAALLHPDELTPVQRVRSGATPDGWRARMDHTLLIANADVMVPRTVLIDDALRARGNPQLVIIGAGLDGRAWRMPDLADVDVFEVDRAASQADKVARVGDLAPLARSLHLVAVDLARDALGPALEQAGQLTTSPTTWIWEGVVQYLSREEVEATVAALAARSAPGSRLIVNYDEPSRFSSMARLALRAMTRLGGRDDPLAREPHRSSWTPSSMRALLGAHGFQVVADDDLERAAERLALTLHHRRYLRTSHVAVADRSARR